MKPYHVKEADSMENIVLRSGKYLPEPNDIAFIIFPLKAVYFLDRMQYNIGSGYFASDFSRRDGLNHYGT